MLGYCLNNSNTPFVLVEDDSYLNVPIMYVDLVMEGHASILKKMSHVFVHSSHQGYSLVNTIGVMFKLG